VKGHSVTPKTSILLRMKHGLKVTVSKRCIWYKNYISVEFILLYFFVVFCFVRLFVFLSCLSVEFPVVCTLLNSWWCICMHVSCARLGLGCIINKI
jgi:hypothetical protein